ncbi:unnamed protein product [Debaryomyces tyrocola]|nr:unnamed protein product [Debaryomyces tyrocola]
MLYISFKRMSNISYSGRVVKATPCYQQFRRWVLPAQVRILSVTPYFFHTCFLRRILLDITQKFRSYFIRRLRQ